MGRKKENKGGYKFPNGYRLYSQATENKGVMSFLIEDGKLDDFNKALNVGNNRYIHGHYNPFTEYQVRDGEYACGHMILYNN